MNLNRSIQILLSSALKTIGCASAALYEHGEHDDYLYLRGSACLKAGVAWPQKVKPGQYTSSAISIPVFGANHLIGLLGIHLASPGDLNFESLDAAHELTQALASLLLLSRKLRSYDQLAAEISALHFELADEKIADRASGLLEERHSQDTVAAHVDRVADSLRFMDELQATIKDVRSQLNSRRLLHDAKQKLRRDNGITEEEAYLTLRHWSRSTRTPLGEIADRVLSGAALAGERI